jgi:hypothetical protein
MTYSRSPKTSPSRGSRTRRCWSSPHQSSAYSSHATAETSRRSHVSGPRPDAHTPASSSSGRSTTASSLRSSPASSVNYSSGHPTSSGAISPPRSEPTRWFFHLAVRELRCAVAHAQPKVNFGSFGITRARPPSATAYSQRSSSRSGRTTARSSPSNRAARSYRTSKPQPKPTKASLEAAVSRAGATGVKPSFGTASRSERGREDVRIGVAGS